MSERRVRSDKGVPRKMVDPRMEFLRYFARQSKVERESLLRDLQFVSEFATPPEVSAAALPGEAQ